MACWLLCPGELFLLCLKPSFRQLEHQSWNWGPAALRALPGRRVRQQVPWGRRRHPAQTLSADRQVFPSCPPTHAHPFLPVVPALSSSVARVTEGIDAALWPAQSWYTGLHSSRRTLQHGKTRTHTSRPVLKQPCRCAPLYGSNSETISAK